jgi:diacylglycerol O-acyltransferase / wax synthase
MKRLSATDSSLLSMETSVSPMQVGGLVTLDTTAAPDFGFERVRELYAGRIPRVPKLTWKLKQVPFRLDRPLWVDGGDLDIDQHLERIVVPSPGGPREVAAVVGDVFSRPLDRRVPLWRMWYLDGLPDGAAALFSRTITVSWTALPAPRSAASCSTSNRTPDPTPSTCLWARAVGTSPTSSSCSEAA